MFLEEQIKRAILEEAQKLIDRYQSYHNLLHLEHSRKAQRLSSVAPKIVKTPQPWSFERRLMMRGNTTLRGMSPQNSVRPAVL